MHKHLPARWDVDEAWYFVTVVTRERQLYFKSEKTCRIFLKACHSVVDKHPYRLGALVILPDHWHALIKPQGKEVIETIVGSLKMRVFHATRRGADEKGAGVEPRATVVRWQSRFMDHRLRDEEDYLNHLEYMRINPWKHQLIEDEKSTWPWWFSHPNPFV